MHQCNSNDLTLIQVVGPDAEKFLQGQLTCDVHALAQQPYLIGAHCDPKGRIQATFRLFKKDNDYYFLLPKSNTPHLLQCLQKYAVFSKVKLIEVDLPDLLIAFQKQLWPTTEAWELQDIHTGIATVFPETRGAFTPHQLNYHLVNGISFNKGCYTGQEIIARMHYLGKLKQQLHQVSFTTEQPLILGTSIHNADQQTVGTLINIAETTPTHYVALAVLQNDALPQSLYLTAKHPILLTLQEMQT